MRAHWVFDGASIPSTVFDNKQPRYLWTDHDDRSRWSTAHPKPGHEGHTLEVEYMTEGKKRKPRLTTILQCQTCLGQP